MKRIHSLLVILIVALIVPAVYQLLLPGLAVTDDGEWMVIRFSSFYQELVSGQFPVRFLNRLNNGYGYPVATFLYPGFMYAASLFKILGLGFVASVKLVFVMSAVSGMIGSYMWLKNRFSIPAALAGSVLFIYHPYFLWDIYKRGSIGEVLVLGIVPLVFYCIDKQRLLSSAVLGAFVIVSHNTMALFFIPLFCLYILAALYQKKVPKMPIRSIVLFLVVSLGLSAFFWIPALFELSLTVFQSVRVSAWRTYFVEDVSLIGVISLFSVVAGVVTAANRRDKYGYVPILMIVVCVLGILFSTSLSSVVWSDQLLGKVVQFPFRFLSLVVVSSAFLLAFVVNGFGVKARNIVAGCLVFLMMMLGMPYMQVQERKTVPDEYYSTNQATTTVQNEYTPVWVAKQPDGRNDRIERLNEQTIQINTVYWPGFEVYAGGRSLPIDFSNEFGLMHVVTGEDVSNIVVSFRETPMRLFADSISIVTLLLMYPLSKKIKND